MIMRHLARLSALILLTLALLELALRLLDPWGIALYSDAYQLALVLEADPALGYRLPAGTYPFHNWTATEQADGRRLPEGQAGPCHLVLLGDSVTFGWGVDDSDTWANLVAAQLPGVSVTNPALDGYGIEQVVGLGKRYPADAYLYLAIPNDTWPGDDLAALRAQADPRGLPYTLLYLLHLRRLTNGYHFNAYDANLTLFATGMERLANDNRVTVVAFDDAFGRAVATRWPVTLIPWYTHRLSFADSHPDRAGHAEIARAILPIARRVVQARCTVI